MTLSAAESVDANCRITTEHEACVVMSYSRKDKRSIAEISGSLRGPSSAYARTLASDFRVVPYGILPATGAFGEIVVVDPCYWTPALPFFYELNLNIRFVDGEMHSIKHSI